jgi:Ca2+-transporting ATPase
VLALACKPLPDGDERLDGGFDFLGLAALRDPLRAGAAEAVRRAARAGIRTMILTGDQPATAAAVARAVGLDGEVFEVDDLSSRMEHGEAGALAQLDRAAGFARVTPADKVAIVRALRRRGDVVAMAGDGINDAPALRSADVGIAVGAQASDIARQTADIVLETPDLVAILHAVGEGRIVQDNLRRSVRFLFGSNLSEVVLMVGAALVGTTPLKPLQLLWLNVLSDSLPGLALALEPGRPEVLDRPPVAPGSPILSRVDWRALVRDGVLMAALAGAAFTAGGAPFTLVTIVGVQIGYAIACRARNTPATPRFGQLIGGAAGLQLAAMALPPLRAALQLPALAGPPLAAFAGTLGLPPGLRDGWSSLRCARTTEVTGSGLVEAPAIPILTGHR